MANDFRVRNAHLTKLGDNAVYLNFTYRFRLLNPHVNITYLRPYRLCTSSIGSPPARLSVKPVSVEPYGSTWYEIEEILDHRGSATNTGECLVRWKDFDASHDCWIPRHSVTPLTLRAYEEFLIAHAQVTKCLGDRTNRKSNVTRAHTARKHLASFIGRTDVRRQTSNVEISSSLQPLLQSLHHQRRLMFRKTLPLRRLRLLLLFLLRVGYFVDLSIIRIRDDRHFFFFFFLSLEICFIVFVFFLVFNLV